jgi:hypothetical protein
MADLRPGQRVLIPALYAHQLDRTATVVLVAESTRQLWVKFDGTDVVREISTYHARPLKPQLSDQNQ